MTDPPDLPNLEPTPSMAAFSFELHSLERGTKASSFVASNKVYLEALTKQFCKEPKKTQRARGEKLSHVPINPKFKSLKKKKKKKATPVIERITGEIMALKV